MIRADLTQVRQLEHQVRRMREQAIPYAVRFAMNGVAFDARRYWVDNMRQQLTLRNRWTERSPRVEQGRSLDMNRMQAVLGSPLEYLEDVEFGGVNTSPIPTGKASGEGRTRNRRQTVRRRNRQDRLQARRLPRQQPIAQAVAEAISDRQRVVLAERGHPLLTAGIYRIEGGTARRPERASLQLVQAHDPERTTTRARPIMREAAEQANAGAVHKYADALRFQLRRMQR